jgi:proteasome lid subunit RPN8/RPN11
MKKKQKKMRQQNVIENPWETPVLRFSPTAWAKLLYFRDYGETEIGGFGITDADDLLYVRDFVTVQQDVSVVSVAFDDEAIANYFEDQVDAGLQPQQFFRLWCHTHPGASAQPSCTDEQTFQRVFGRSEWAIMFILAKENQIYARLRFNVGPGGETEIPVQVDYTRSFGSSDAKTWEEEYTANIKPVHLSDTKIKDHYDLESDDWTLPSDIVDQLKLMEPEERQNVMDELAGRADLWHEESEAW